MTQLAFLPESRNGTSSIISMSEKGVQLTAATLVIWASFRTVQMRGRKSSLWNKRMEEDEDLKKSGADNEA